VKALGAGGAFLGSSVAPGIGTAIGGIAGGIVGGVLGYWGGSEAGIASHDLFSRM
jgi:hypothetical protein